MTLASTSTPWSSLRKTNSGCIPSRDSKRQTSPPHIPPPSTVTPLKALYPTASPPGSATSRHLNDTTWTGWGREPVKSLVPLSPFYWRSSMSTAFTELSVSSRTLSTLLTICFLSYHQGRCTRASVLDLAGCWTALSCRKSESLTDFEAERRWKINQSHCKNIGHSQYNHLECPDEKRTVNSATNVKPVDQGIYQQFMTETLWEL